MANLQFDVVALDKASKTFVAMAQQVERLSEKLDKIDGRQVKAALDLEDKKANRQADAFEARMRRIDGSTSTVHVKIDRDSKSFAEAVAMVGQLDKGIKTLIKPIAVLGITPVLVSAAGAAAQASTSLLLLPAAAAAGVIAAGALKVGFQGVTDALGPTGTQAEIEKVNAALAKLDPQARATVEAIRAQKPAWDALQLDVQGSLFDGMATRISDIAGKYLPVLRTGLDQSAIALNNNAKGIAAYVAEAGTVSSVKTIFDNTGLSMQALEPVGRALAQILIDIGTVGSEFLPPLAAGFTESAQKAADFIREARESGKLREWISDGLSVVGDLGKAFINIGGIVTGFWRATGTDAAEFSTTLLDVTEKVKGWVNSFEGQERIGEFFGHMRDLTAVLGPLVGAVALAMVGMFEQIVPALPPLIQGITDVFNATGPLLGVFAHLLVAILPGLGALLSDLAPILGPVVVAITAAMTASKIYGITVSVLGSIQKGYALFLGIMRIAEIGYSAAKIEAAAATGTLTLAQRGLNLALAANPIGIVITILIALVAAIVFAWQNSETFRSIVIGAWEGIKAAALAVWEWLQEMFASFMAAMTDVGAAATWLWDNVKAAWDGIQSAALAVWTWMQSMFESFKAAMVAVGDAAMWLYENAIKPAFDFIMTIGKILVGIYVMVVIMPIINIFKALGAVAMWLWEAAIKPAWEAIIAAILFGVDAIVAGMTWLWEKIKFVWDMIVAGITFACALVTGIWQGILNYLSEKFSPGFSLMGAIIAAVWKSITDAINLAWGLIQTTWNIIIDFMAGVFKTAWDALASAIKFVWDGIGAGIDFVWVNIIKPVFDAISFALGVVKTAFDTCVQGISDAWGKIQGIVGPPIKFMVQTVYNEGIVPAWNWIAGIVHLDPLQTVELKFAAGGAVPGYGFGDTVAAMLTPGEFVVRKDIAGPTRPFLDALNAGQPEAMQATGARGFAAGGSVEAGLAFARSMEGKPYIWGGAGPMGADCSGFMSQITNVLLGRPPHRRLGTTASSPWPGFTEGLTSAFTIGYDRNSHMAGTLGGINVESGSGHGPMVGGRALGSTSGFAGHMSLPEAGGQFVAGAGGGGGGVFDVVGFLAEKWNDVKAFVDKIGEYASSPWGQGAGKMVTSMIDGAYQFVVDKVTGFFASFMGTSGVESGASSTDAPGIVKNISDVARARFGNLARKAAITGTATGIVESGLRNLPGGDRDSVGVFQQRPSQGWGTIEECMNVTHAANMFFSKFPGNWASRDQGEVAQSVQRSRFPDRYGQRMAEAANLVALHGGFGGGLTTRGGMATGGIVRHPTFGLIGEAGAEAVVPLTNPAAAANVMRQAGLGGTVIKNYNVHITATKVDGADVEAAIRRMELLDGADVLHG